LDDLLVVDTPKLPSYDRRCYNAAVSGGSGMYEQ